MFPPSWSSEFTGSYTICEFCEQYCQDATRGLPGILLFMASLIVDVKWQNGCSLSVTLHPLDWASFHLACHDQKWEWLGRRGPIPCAPCTTSYLVHQTPWWRGIHVEGETIPYSLFLGWKSGDTKYPLCWIIAKCCWCQQLSNHRHNALHCSAEHMPPVTSLHTCPFTFPHC